MRSEGAAGGTFLPLFQTLDWNRQCSTSPGTSCRLLLLYVLVYDSHTHTCTDPHASFVQEFEARLVHLAIVLCLRPDFVLLDDPTACLDPQLTFRCVCSCTRGGFETAHTHPHITHTCSHHRHAFAAETPAYHTMHGCVTFSSHVHADDQCHMSYIQPIDPVFPIIILSPWHRHRVEHVLKACGLALVWATTDRSQPERIGGRILALPLGTQTVVGGVAPLPTPRHAHQVSIDEQQLNQTYVSVHRLTTLQEVACRRLF